MITIQIPDLHQTDAVSRFIEEHHLSFTAPVNQEESMVLVEDGRILGYAAYTRQADEAVVTLIFIDPPMRQKGFGDGLFRALLNLMERSGIVRFFIAADADTKGFLVSEDLCPSPEGPFGAKTPQNAVFWFEGTLPEFFQKPCKGGRQKR